MEQIGSQVVTEASTQSVQLAETIAQYTETMNAVERLCLQSGETLINLSKKDNNGFYCFVRKVMVWTDSEKNEHPTTSAQCISAMQDLVRVLDGIKVTQVESANLPFQPIAIGRVDKEVVHNLRIKLGKTINKQLEHLANRPPLGNAPANSDCFGELNPFTCAHIFRALSPSNYLISNGCWSALFGILLALQRTYPNYRGASGVAMPHSLPTAFVTSHCYDAVESLVETLSRRESRFECWIKLISDLETLESEKLAEKYVNESHEHQKKTVCQKLVNALKGIS